MEKEDKVFYIGETITVAENEESNSIIVFDSEKEFVARLYEEDFEFEEKTFKDYILAEIKISGELEFVKFCLDCQYGQFWMYDSKEDMEEEAGKVERECYNVIGNKYFLLENLNFDMTEDEIKEEVIKLKGEKMEKLIEYIKEKEQCTDFTVEILNKIIEYGLKHERVSKDMFVYWLLDMIPNLEFGEIAQFVENESLTDNGINEKNNWIKKER